MKKFTEKLSKLIVTVVCASMIFQTVGIHVMATEAGDGVDPVIEEGVSEEPAPVVDPVPTTEPVPTEEPVPTTETEATPVNEKVVAYEEQLKGIGQSALDKLAEKCSPVANVEANMDGVIANAQKTYDEIAAATEMKQELLNKMNEFSKHTASSQDVLAKANKALELAKSIVANAEVSYERTLTKAQSKEADVTGAEGRALLDQAATIVDAYAAMIIAAEAKTGQIQEIQNNAMEVFSQKPVVAYFYVLNRGLDIPEGVFGRSKDYSDAAMGELFGGVAEGDYSYLATYQTGQILYGDVAKHLKTVPTREAINAVLALEGDQLAEDETIEWYGIVRSGGIMHVDGRIVKMQIDDTTENDDANEDNNEDANEGNNEDANEDANEDGNEDANEDANDDANEGGNNNDNNVDANVGNNNDNNVDANVGNNNDNNVDANVDNNNDNNVDANVGNNNDNNNTNEGNDENNGTDEELTTIEEEEVPLASTITDLTVIEDEETPLASGIVDVCKTHWIIMLLIMLYAAVQTVCIVSRNKKIKQMKEDLNNIAM